MITGEPTFMKVFQRSDDYTWTVGKKTNTSWSNMEKVDALNQVVREENRICILLSPVAAHVVSFHCDCLTQLIAQASVYPGAHVLSLGILEVIVNIIYLYNWGTNQVLFNITKDCSHVASKGAGFTFILLFKEFQASALFSAACILCTHTASERRGSIFHVKNHMTSYSCAWRALNEVVCQSTANRNYASPNFE